VVVSVLLTCRPTADT